MNVSILSAYPLVIVRITCCGLCLSCLGGLSAQAQITFTANKLPAVVGDYADEYVSTDTDPSAIIGPTGGPQAWDFSYALQSGDIIRRMDIVSPTNGGYQASFPQATYAERYTDVPDNVLEWDYYNIVTNAGRHYFGSCVPNTVTNVFSPPPIDIPAVVGYGTNWSYTMTTTAAPYSEQDTVSATADAFGTVMLPKLGSFQALRVNQLTTTLAFYNGQYLYTIYMREYYWLVPGFDKAVHIVSQADYAPIPAIFASAHEVRRVFATKTVSNTPRPVAGLHIKLQPGQAVLNWLAARNASAYQVQAVGGLAQTNWQVLASPATNSWSESTTTTQRFYRVFIEP